MRLREVIADEMASYAVARMQGDTVAAWRALERTHILSQSYLGLHLANHCAMLCFAARERDVREIVGQILRLALAPLGAISGHTPTGNTGRSNVSAFAPMEVPADILAILKNNKS
jgi:hypothetical protein